MAQTATVEQGGGQIESEQVSGQPFDSELLDHLVLYTDSAEATYFELYITDTDVENLGFQAIKGIAEMTFVKAADIYDEYIDEEIHDFHQLARQTNALNMIAAIAKKASDTNNVLTLEQMILYLQARQKYYGPSGVTLRREIKRYLKS